MTLPTVISQIIYVIYNMADTWFAGLTGDANTVAAVSLCLPVYNLMTGLSNLFGISGASAMARALGEHDRDKTRHCCAVAIWSALGGGIEGVWATPITESFGLVLGLVLLRRFWGTWIDA